MSAYVRDAAAPTSARRTAGAGGERTIVGVPPASGTTVTKRSTGVEEFPSASVATTRTTVSVGAETAGAWNEREKLVPVAVRDEPR